MRYLLTAALAAGLCAGTATLADDAAKGHCPVSGKAAVAEQKKEVDGSTLYFCCPGCPGAYDKAKHAAAGNYQLAVTKQIKQKGCPFSGGAVDAATKVKVGKSEVEIGFCCASCKAKYEAAKDDKAKIELVFKDIAKGFEKVVAK